MPIHFFAAGKSKGSQDCVIRTDDSMHGKQRPDLLIGRVAVQGTSDRDNPPDPISDFPCGWPNSPFGKGHIMALSLGGPDMRENIVPQYEMWQANGAWRAMERKSETDAKPGDFFVVQIDYDDGTNALPAQSTRFQHHEIFDWAEYRIPTKFTIWIVKQVLPIGICINSDVLGAGKSLFERGNAAAKVLGQLASVSPSKVFDHSVMPEEDRKAWQDEFSIVPAAEDALAQYNEQRVKDIAKAKEAIEKDGVLTRRRTTEAADVTRSPLHTMTTFTLEHSDLIQKEIGKQHGSNFTDSEIASLTTHRMLRAHMFVKQGGSVDQQINHAKQKRKDNLNINKNKRKPYEDIYERQEKKGKYPPDLGSST